MTKNTGRTSWRALDPKDRASEVLFGLIMALTFTGSLSVAESGSEDVRAMLIGALGCNIAWGIIDAVFYLMGGLAERGSGLLRLRAARSATETAKARRLVAGALPEVVAAVMEPAELDAISRRLKNLPEPPKHAKLRKEDWLGAAGVFLWVFVSTFPVTVPFMFMHETLPAMRASNAIAIALLFLTGFVFGRISGRSPWAYGLSMVALGSALVAMTIALGG